MFSDPGFLGKLYMSAVAQVNDYNSFNLLAVGPDTENYTKVFLSHFFSVSLTLVFSFSLSLPHIHSLYLKHYHPPRRRTFALRKHCTRRRGNDRAHSTNAIRPRKHQYVQVMISYIPRWYKDYKGLKLCAILYARWNSINTNRTANTITQKQLLYYL